MRYKPEHKERTRERIVTHAARLFRRHGYDGVGVDTIMAASKLTRGGFYGYFRSKAALFAAVLRGEHDFITRMRARPGGTRGELTREALVVVDGYLHPDNRERVGRGCHMASLSTDVARGGADARRAYTEKVRELAIEFARGLEKPAGTPELDPRALAAMALCVGGLVVSRALDDEELADAISGACRNAVADQLEARSA